MTKEEKEVFMTHIFMHKPNKDQSYVIHYGIRTYTCEKVKCGFYYWQLKMRDPSGKFIELAQFPHLEQVAPWIEANQDNGITVAPEEDRRESP